MSLVFLIALQIGEALKHKSLKKILVGEIKFLPSEAFGGAFVKAYVGGFVEAYVGAFVEAFVGAFVKAFVEVFV